MRLDARMASLLAFLAGIPTYLAAFIITIRALSAAYTYRGGAVLARFERQWLFGRALAILAFVLFAASVGVAFAAPPGRPGRSRMWWVVPATVAAIAVALFDFRGLGFRF